MADRTDEIQMWTHILIQCTSGIWWYFYVSRGQEDMLEEINFPSYIWVNILSCLEAYEMIHEMEILKRDKRWIIEIV